MHGVRRIGFGILAATIALLVLTSGSRAEDKKAASDLTGTWKSSFTTNNGTTIESTYHFKQDGEKLTGTVVGTRGGEAKLEEGKVKDGKVSFQVTREFNDQKFTIKYTGDVNGNTIKGKVEFGQGDQTRSRDWEAKRVEKTEDKKEK